MSETAARSEAIADLQNVADCFLLGALIRQDQLTHKAGLDWTWLADTSKYPIASLPIPKTAETVVHISGNAIATGGVSMTYRAFTGVERHAAAQQAPGLPPNRPTTTWFLTLAARSQFINLAK